MQFFRSFWHLTLHVYNERHRSGFNSYFATHGSLSVGCNRSFPPLKPLTLVCQQKQLTECLYWHENWRPPRGESKLHGSTGVENNFWRSFNHPDLDEKKAAEPIRILVMKGKLQLSRPKASLVKIPFDGIKPDIGMSDAPNAPFWPISWSLEARLFIQHYRLGRSFQCKLGTYPFRWIQLELSSLVSLLASLRVGQFFLSLFYPNKTRWYGEN